MISLGVYRFLGMTMTSLGCGPVYHSPWTEFARAGQISLSKFKVGQYTGRTTLVAAHLLEPAIQREASQAEVFGSQ
jgi:hypothetical protein